MKKKQIRKLENFPEPPISRQIWPNSKNIESDMPTMSKISAIEYFSAGLAINRI